jgi:hypothetical protein
MVDAGLEHAAKDPSVHLRFDCFNKAESDLVGEIMAERPEVSFSTTYMTWDHLKAGTL